jgi:hypothetical protein
MYDLARPHHNSRGDPYVASLSNHLILLQTLLKSSIPIFVYILDGYSLPEGVQKIVAT